MMSKVSRILFQRRQFLMFSSFLGLSLCVECSEKHSFVNDFEKVRPLILAVQEHMFPEDSKLPSANKMHSINFLHDTVAHKCYDKDIRKFVLDGARVLDKRAKGEFLNMTFLEKEKILREYEEIEYGNNWLRHIMILTLEGMLADPIYGSNIKKLGWKTLLVSGGKPEPKRRYLDV